MKAVVVIEADVVDETEADHFFQWVANRITYSYSQSHASTRLIHKAADGKAESILRVTYSSHSDLREFVDDLTASRMTTIANLTQDLAQAQYENLLTKRCLELALDEVTRLQDEHR